MKQILDFLKQIEKQYYIVLVIALVLYIIEMILLSKNSPNDLEVYLSLIFWLNLVLSMVSYTKSRLLPYLFIVITICFEIILFTVKIS